MNKYKQIGNYTIMEIVKNNKTYEVKIDNDDVELVKQYNWYLHHTGYPYAWLNKNRTTSLHLLLFREHRDHNLMIDHINRDKLDNRKENLRQVTRSINSTNAKARADKTQLDLPRGVTFNPENEELRPDGKGQKRYANFEVQWSIEGKRKTKTFSIKKLGGYENARKAAISFREQILKEIEDIV